MSIKQAIFGERSLTKVAALFPSRATAESAAMQVRQATGMDESQVKLVGPPDGSTTSSSPLSRKLEPEQAGIWHTLIRAHVLAGAAGAILGALLFLGLLAAGNVAVSSTPLMSLVSMVFFGGLFGLMVGGLITLRPDHARVISAVRHAIKRGGWAVVTHPVNHTQVEQATHELRLLSHQVVRTL